MKIRTDFVTNSSSSCFCVELSLTFDNGKSISLHGNEQDGDPENYCDCGNLEEETLSNTRWKLAANFSDVVEARDDIEKLKKVLSGFTNNIPKKELKGATRLTYAFMAVNSCVSGEWTYLSDPTKMLDIDAIDSSKDKEKQIMSLRKQGLKCYSDEALETIIDSFEEEGSKRFEFEMNDDGEIEASMNPAEYYSDGSDDWDGDDW